MPQDTPAAGSTARRPAPPTDPVAHGEAAHRDPAHPPGPAGPSALHTARYWIDPRRAVHGWRQRFGDVFTATINPLGRTVFVCDAALIRTILLAGDDTFRAGAANAKLGDTGSEYSVLSTDGPQHARSRAMMTPAFHGRSVARQVADIERLTRECIESWPLGRPFRLLGPMQDLAMSVIMRVVMGAGEDGAAEVRRALTDLASTESPVDMMVSGRLLESLLPHVRRRQRRLTDAMDVLQRHVETHRRDPELDRRHDVLAMMLRTPDADGGAMSTREVQDQLVTLLLAGHETTAAGMAWTLERLARTPEVLERARVAADEDDVGYLDAVVKESLRIRSVVPDLSRLAMRDVQVGPYLVTAGTMVVPCIDEVHESPDNFADPQAFRPERFVDGSVPAAAWLPFGGGVRRCLGATFALVEMRVMLQTVLRSRTIEPVVAPAEARRRRLVTVEPARGAVITVRARRD